MENLSHLKREGMFYKSLESMKNREHSWDTTNPHRADRAAFIDEAAERAARREERWVQTTSQGLKAGGTPATSDPCDPRRYHRGAKAAPLPPKG
jgi:hypothetical protein